MRVAINYGMFESMCVHYNQGRLKATGPTGCTLAIANGLVPRTPPTTSHHCHQVLLKAW